MKLYVKICGLCTARDIEAALEAGADGIGLVLSPSPRQVRGRRLRELFEQLPESVERIAVLARPTRDLMKDLLAYAFDGIQFEAPHRAELEQRLSSRQGFLLPSFRDANGLLQRLRDPLQALGQEAAASSPGTGGRPSLEGAFVLDGPGGGGQGVAAATPRAAKAAQLGPMLLAGGLCADSVGPAIERVRPFGVDVSSGVEASRGVKDPARIHAFVQAARQAAAAIDSEPSHRS